MRDFRTLDVWAKAHAFTLNVYRATEAFPKAETFGLATTLRRGSAHIAMKISEACGQDGEIEFGRYLQFARPMCADVEYQLLLARDLQFIEPPAYDALQRQLVEVRKMLSGLIKTVSV